MRADPLLAGTKEMCREQPLMQWDMGPFVDGAELASADANPIKATARALSNRPDTHQRLPTACPHLLTAAGPYMRGNCRRRGISVASSARRRKRLLDGDSGAMQRASGSQPWRSQPTMTNRVAARVRRIGSARAPSP